MLPARNLCLLITSAEQFTLTQGAAPCTMRAEALDKLGSMIHVLTRGGLGNQMFQYAYALQLQRANAGKNIYLNGISHPFASDNRKLGLHHFQLTEKTRYSLFSLPATMILNGYASIIILMQNCAM
jgi:hypothetical protein